MAEICQPPETEGTMNFLPARRPKITKGKDELREYLTKKLFYRNIHEFILTKFMTSLAYEAPSTNDGGEGQALVEGMPIRWSG